MELVVFGNSAAELELPDEMAGHLLSSDSACKRQPYFCWYKVLVTLLWS
jgi:hypothetical protein